MGVVNNGVKSRSQSIIDAELKFVGEVLSLAQAAISSDRQFYAFRKSLFEKYHKFHKQRILKIVDATVQDLELSEGSRFLPKIKFEADESIRTVLEQGSLSDLPKILGFLKIEDDTFEAIKIDVLECSDTVQPSGCSSDELGYIRSLASLDIVRDMLGCSSKA